MPTKFSLKFSNISTNCNEFLKFKVNSRIEKNSKIKSNPPRPMGRIWPASRLRSGLCGLPGPERAASSPAHLPGREWAPHRDGSPAGRERPTARGCAGGTESMGETRRGHLAGQAAQLLTTGGQRWRPKRRRGSLPVSCEGVTCMGKRRGRSTEVVARPKG
jgi:hypothetical protein